MSILECRELMESLVFLVVTVFLVSTAFQAVKAKMHVRRMPFLVIMDAMALRKLKLPYFFKSDSSN